MFFKGFEKAVFWSLKLLMALLGSSCFFLGKSGPKMGFQNGYQKWPKKKSRNREAINLNNLMTTCFGYPFWIPIGSSLKQIWNPFWDPKLVQNLLIFGSNFGSLFWGFWISLGASWEPSWASWGSLARPQEWKNADSPTRKPLFYKCSFLVFEASNGPIGLILFLLGQIWSQNGVPKWGAKVGKKVIKK